MVSLALWLVRFLWCVISFYVWQTRCTDVVICRRESGLVEDGKRSCAECVLSRTTCAAVTRLTEGIVLGLVLCFARKFSQPRRITICSLTPTSILRLPRVRLASVAPRYIGCYRIPT